jgi:Ser/Thr protein kinase RdoA (MazF antagonist)
VLWQVEQNGFRLAPLPLPAVHRKGYVRHQGALWELTPWMPGRADFHDHPTPYRLGAAMQALAEFHEAASGFPLPIETDASPGIRQRLQQLTGLEEGGLSLLEQSLTPAIWPELVGRAQRLLRLFPRAAPRVRSVLEQAARQNVPLIPCIRDIWHDHVLFSGERVSGLVDFGAMQAECAAADVARLLGSLVADDASGWQIGLDAYSAVRRMSVAERGLVTAFDQSSVLLGGLAWIRWIYVERRWFDHPDQVLKRVDEIIDRLEVLAGAKLA